jgi:hypothetical protein
MILLPFMTFEGFALPCRFFRSLIITRKAGQYRYPLSRVRTDAQACRLQLNGR